MSLVIENLKFTIFASGHDYTLNNSGTGDSARVFSHPFVPLNSVNYAGQYYFLVPDENGDMMDAVKDDIAHCTFEPALGTAFGTEGETTVKVTYHREYIEDESTIIVDRTFEDVIQVVNHGTVSDSTNNLDVYSDGYGFIRPLSVNGVEVKDYSITGKNAVTKLSSMPWRATGLGVNPLTGFFSSRNLTDISELAFADVSKCTKFYGLFENDRSLSDISAVSDWDVSSVETIYHFAYYTDISSLEALAKWNTPNLKNLNCFLQHAEKITSLHGLENLDTSNVTNMSYMCDMCILLSDISAVIGWNTDKVTTMSCGFIGTAITNVDAFGQWTMPALKDISQIVENCSRLADLSGMSNWVSKLNTIRQAFSGCDALVDISGLYGLDTSEVTVFTSAFEYDDKILSLHGLENWDFSSGQYFYRMFKGCTWLSDISALANKDMSHATNLVEMFSGNAWILDVDDTALWRLSTTAVGNMFGGNIRACYSSKLGKNLYETAYYFYDYSGTRYVNSEVQDEEHLLSYPTYDADKASLWGLSGSGLNAFDSRWTNTPSWN